MGGGFLVLVFFFFGFFFSDISISCLFCGESLSGIYVLVGMLFMYV